jgi:hypothetical protein
MASQNEEIRGKDSLFFLAPSIADLQAKKTLINATNK